MFKQRINSSGVIAPLVLVGMAVIVVFLFVAFSGPFSSQLLSTIFPKNSSFAAAPGVLFVDSSNQPITSTTVPMAKIMLTSPWSVKGQASLLDFGFSLVSTANAQVANSGSIVLTASGNANEDGNVVSNNKNTVWIGNGGSTTKSLTGFRYTGVNIPKGAKITSANLQVYSTQAPWISVNTDIFAENKSNSAAFSNSSRPSQRLLTTAKAQYSADNKWNQNTWYTLADVSPVIQEVVNRSDWVSGNSMSIILKGTGGAFGRKYVTGRGNNGAKLTITYTGGQASAAPSAAPSTNPNVSPSPVVSPSPSVSPYVVSVKIAEDSAFTKNVKDINPVISNPTYLDYMFSDTSYGAKTVYAKFVSSTGEEKTYSASIQYAQAQASAMPSHDMSGGVGSNSHAMGLWTPNPKYDTCTKEQHDGYKVQGPDGKWYPTWHPPVDPASGCKFGHEHGRDPKGTAMWSFIQEQFGYDADKNGIVEGGELATAGLPFGYANEQLDIYNTSKGITNGMRHEDHVGHKIEWENNVRRTKSSDGAPSGEGNNFSKIPTGVYCDFLMKPHQGTHSKDAFTNNMHELGYFVQCRDAQGGAIGTKVGIYSMIIFGRPGGFSAGGVAGGFTFVPVGQAVPANSPSNDSPGRAIPTIERVLQHVLVPTGQWSKYSEGIYEDWIGGNYIRRPGSTDWLVYFDPHFAVFSPSRFYWPGSDANNYGIVRTAEDKANNIGRSVDLCFMNENGEVARGGECEWMTNYGQVKSMAWDDPRSAFNGIKREMYFNQTGVKNSGGSTVWYTDPFGNNAQTSPFAGSVKQYVSAVNNERKNSEGFIDPSGGNFAFESEAIGAEREYGGNGVHAPN